MVITHPSPGEAHRATALAGDAGRDRLIVLLAVTAIVALAWAYLARLAHQMGSDVDYRTAMAAMGMATDVPWTLTDAALVFAMWVVMMLGMMGAATVPVLLLFVSAQRARSARGVRLSVLLFGSGYLLLWAAFSACAALAQWLLHHTAMLSPAMKAASPRLAAAILVLAGAYQLTPLKRACLTHCRSPLGFLMTNWRDGMLGAVRMGARYGTYCLGCCWALMGVLFVVGVMNLAWVMTLTVLVLLEKVVPGGVHISRAAGIAMIAAAVLGVM
jgi:predicted metal-binding membrane protein